jgi:peptidoglycan/xylan/chitin deacetylase (PgdA/CDA1 family)
VRPRLRYLLVLVAPLLIAAQSAESDETLGAAAAPPWTRSIVCPVLYGHEIVSQPVLRRFLLGVMAAGYQPTSLAAVDAAMSGTADPPAGCLVLTFDDGLLSQYVNGLPVLTELGVPAVFFAMPAFSDGVHRYMRAPELRALADAGFEVEAHTCNHPNLPVLARRNLSGFFAELEDCRRLLEAVTGAPVDYLAYPSGGFDPLVMDSVAHLKYRAAFTTRPSAYLSASNPFSLPRFRFDPSEAPLTVVRRIRAGGA